MKNRKKLITILIAAAAAVFLLLGYVVFAHRRHVSQLEQEDALSLSEISAMTFICPEGGGLCSWAELYNDYEQDTDISGFSLSLDSGESYVFPEGSVLPAGGYILVHFGGGCGGITETKWATPGQVNTRDGYEEYCKGQTSGSPLVLNEVMAANQSWLYQYDIGSYCDWVELKNISDSPVLLSDYWLSDDEDDYFQWQLPEISLAPGETTIVYCTNDITDATRSGFSLDANE